jgi:predicted nucleic acid-binding protein
MADVPSAYFDSCIFIELLQQSDKDRLEACEALHEQAKSGRLIIVTSAASIIEVNKLPESPGLPEEQSKNILAFFAHSYIVVRNLDRQVAEYAHDLTRTHGLLPLDAVHVATAVVNKVPVLYTYDMAKGRRKGLLSHHLKIGSPPLRIEMPPKPSSGPLFDAVKEEDEDGSEGAEPS